MVVISQIDLFTALKEKLGEPQAKMLAEYVEQKVNTTVDAAKEHLATKEDLAKVEGVLRKEIAEAKNDTIKWMVSIFLALALMINGLYLKK